MRIHPFNESVPCYSAEKRTRFFFHLLEINEDEGQYSIKGGKTILGRIFSYQERTGASLEEIYRMPYIQFVIGMLDAPSVEYDKKEKKKDAESQVNSLTSFLS